MNYCFSWLKVLIDDYENRMGDGKGYYIWNWFLENYKPDGWECLVENQLEDQSDN